MSDKDHVFARLGPAKPSSGARRELLNIPRKGSGAGGSRVVEVVHVRPGSGAPAGKEAAARRPRFGGHAETWEHGFPTRSAPLPPAEPPPEPPRAEAAEPVAHVMPMWEPAPVPEPPPAAPDDQPPAAAVPRRSRGASADGARRRVADPFDAADDAMNCLRCGYVVEPARERRGLMTCAACG